MAMDDIGHQPCRLTIVGGSTNQEKASWLASQLDAGVFGEALVVFADAASAAFASQLPSLRAVVSNQACACCGSKGGLIVSLREVLRTRHARLQPFDRIIVEAGGDAEIDGIAAAIQNDSVLAGKLKLAEVVVVMTGTEDAGLLDDEPLLARQIESADCVVFTAPASHPGLERAIDRVKPGVPIFAAQSQ